MTTYNFILTRAVYKKQHKNYVIQAGRFKTHKSSHYLCWNKFERGCFKNSLLLLLADKNSMIHYNALNRQNFWNLCINLFLAAFNFYVNRYTLSQLL